MNSRMVFGVLALLAASFWFLWTEPGAPTIEHRRSEGRAEASASSRSSPDLTGVSAVATSAYHPVDESVPPAVRKTASLTIVAVFRASGEKATGQRLFLPELSELSPGSDRRPVTDEEGCVRITDLSPGAVRVFGPGGVGRRAVLESGRETRLELSLTRGIEARGRVLDEQGLGVAGAKILARLSDDVEGPTEAVAACDESGRFVASVRPGESLAAWVASHGPSAWCSVGSLEEELVLRLRPRAGHLRVQVRGADGSPTPEAWIKVSVLKPSPLVDEEGRSLSTAPVRVLVTAGDGVADFEGLDVGRHEVAVEALGAASSVREIDVPVLGVAHVEIVASAGAQVSGVVLRDDGSPAVGARIGLAARSSLLTPRHPAVADGKGRFLLTSVPAGPVVLGAYDPVEGRASARLRAAEGERVRCEMRLDPGRVLQGRVLDASGVGRAGDFINVVDEGAEEGAYPVVRSVKTDAQGRFRVTNLDDGRYGVEVYDGSRRSHQPLVVRRGLSADGVSLDLEVPREALPSGRCVGRVRSSDQEPVAARVALLGSGSSTPLFAACDRVSGAFELRNVVPGTYSVSLLLPWNEERMLREIEIPMEGCADLGPLVVPKPASVHLVAELPAGSSATPVKFLLRPIDDAADQRRSDVSGELPRDARMTLAAGGYRVSLWHEETVLQRSHVEVRPGESRDLSIALHRATTLVVKTQASSFPRHVVARRGTEECARATFHDRGEGAVAYLTVGALDLTLELWEGESLLTSRAVTLRGAVSGGFEVTLGIPSEGSKEQGVSTWND